jgi:hypothetical protein
MSKDERNRDQRLRRLAKKHGLELIKSRRRDPRAADWGYFVVQDGWLQTGSYGLGQDAIEEYLTAFASEAVAA